MLRENKKLSLRQLAKISGITSFSYLANIERGVVDDPDDDGNYGGEYIEVKAIRPTKHFDIGGEFAVHLYEIKSIEIVE